MFSSKQNYTTNYKKMDGEYYLVPCLGKCPLQIYSSFELCQQVTLPLP